MPTDQQHYTTVDDVQTIVGDAIKPLLDAIKALTPEQPVQTEQIVNDIRSESDKRYEETISSMMEDVATNGVKLILTSTGRGRTRMLNATSMAHETLMNMHQDYKQYRHIVK